MKNQLKTFRINTTHLLNRFPNLALDKELQDERLKQLVNLNLKIEDYTDIVIKNRKLFARLDVLDRALNDDDLGEDKKLFLQKVTFDLILSASLVPSIYVEREKKGTCFHKTIQPISPDDISFFLDNLYADFKEDKDIIFTRKDTFDYDKASYTQRLFLTSLYNFKDENIDSLLNDKLTEQMYERKDLIEWMFTPSGSIEQQFLNTCNLAAYQQKHAHPAMLVGLTLIGRAIIDKTKNELENKEEPLSMEESYALEKIAQKENELNIFENNLNQMLKGEETTAKQIQQLHNDWGRLFQKTFFLADKPGLAITKPIKNGWLTSSALMFFPVIYRYGKDRISSLKKGEQAPSVDFYLGGKQEIEFLDNFFRFKTKEEVEPISIEDLKNYNDDELKGTRDSLWNSVFQNGGKVIGPKSHFMYVKAGNIDGEKIFLLSDPKVDYYKVYTPEQFLNYIIKNQISFKGDL